METINSPNETLLAASMDDVADVQKLLQQAADFKMAQGDDLWGSEPFTEEEVARMVDAGNLFVLKVDDITAASVILPKNDVRMWGDEQGGDGSAIYIHKLCVGDTFRGQGVGAKVMSLAEDLALQLGRTKLRLDCAYDNRGLCGYYETLGFREVRRYDRPSSAGRRNPDKDVYRAALYEKELTSSSAV